MQVRILTQGVLLTAKTACAFPLNLCLPEGSSMSSHIHRCSTESLIQLLKLYRPPITRGGKSVHDPVVLTLDIAGD